MALSPLPTAYCSNVHPARSAAGVEDALAEYTAPLRDRCRRPVAPGLWLPRSVADELAQRSDAVASLARTLDHLGLTCHTLNAFPYGDFHSPRVKDNVYLPDWSHPDRAEYTLKCASVLARLLPTGVEGSISTLPLGFKGHDHQPAFLADCVRQLVRVAVELAGLADDTGFVIRLAVEPEPLCELETTPETVAFFQKLWQVAEQMGHADAVRHHVGLCFDICHQAVEFEDVAGSVRAIDAAGIRINKVHISSALQLDHPATNPEGRDALRRYIEPRYLHQTFGRLPDGRLVHATDLTEEILFDTGSELMTAEVWRVHFHVPVDADRLGPLGTTRPMILEALTTVAELDYAPHLEVETYTWEVLPGADPVNLVDGLVRELDATHAILDGIAARRKALP